MKKYITIENPKDCCACGACLNICPRDAITMREDAAGYLYPAVEETLCIGCGRCIDACVFTEAQKGANGDPAVYAAVNRDRDVLKQSSSGGVFSVLANAVLEKGGAVFGAAWGDGFTLSHICAENSRDLSKLRGSKYVQSTTGSTFRQAKQFLSEGRFVCYSGTPCQIAGLKAYLGKEYDNLLTVDIICHGVPSVKMLKDDLAAVSGTDLSEIRDVRFRDKSYGWGVNGSLMAGNKKRKYNAGTSPYYFYFLKGEVYRESCYRCRFPSEGRQGDLTLGDYWGIRGELIAKLGDIDPDEGSSCVLANTDKGKQWLSAVGEALALTPTDRKSVEKRNGQLTKPSTPLPEHETLLNGYIRDGYPAFQNGYKKHGKEHLIRKIKQLIPSKIKRKVNDILSK